jgi:hypothetical protein
MKVCGMYIDDFRLVEKGENCILTHWHSDHTAGLNNKFNGVVICSRKTSELLHHFHPHIEYRIVVDGRDEQINGINIRVYDSYHLPGSIMCYFVEQKTLYTGDYRYNVSGMCKLGDIEVDVLYYDATFHDPNTWNISMRDSELLFTKFKARCIDTKLYVGIYHTGTCALLVSTGTKFCFDSSVPEVLVTKLRFLYGSHIVHPSEAECVVIQPHHFKTLHGRELLIPSALWYRCNENQSNHVITRDYRGYWRLNYSGHSDYYENMKLFNHLKPNKKIACGNLKKNLYCERTYVSGT